MNYCYYIFFLSISLLCSDNEIKSNPSKPELTSVKSFGENPGNLNLYYYNPFNSADTTERPMVVVLHGCNQNAKAISELSDWNKLAKLYNFYVLYPEQKRINNASDCFNWFQYEDILKNKGESASILSMCAYMQKNFKIDNKKIFVTGMSAGGAMTVVVLSAYPEKFKAGAAFAGGAYKSASGIGEALKVIEGKFSQTEDALELAVREENPDFNSDYPSLYIYHGTKDVVVNYKNADQLLKQWKSLFPSDSLITVETDNFNSVYGLSLKTVKNDSGVVRIKLYTMNGLGHYYMIKPGDKKDEGGKAGLFSSQKGFHSTWQVAMDFGLVE